MKNKIENWEKKEKWEKKFGILFISKEIGKRNTGKVYTNPEDIKSFIRQLLKQEKEKLLKRIEKERIMDIHKAIAFGRKEGFEDGRGIKNKKR